jgi:ribonuclease P protein component
MSSPRDFRALLRTKQLRGAIFAVQTAENNLPIARLGMIVGKRTTARAVDRNCVKRLIRESFRTRQASLAGRDVLVRVYRPLDSCAKQEARGELADLLDRVAR